MKKLSKIVIIVLACLIAISSVSLGKVFAYFSAKSSASGTVTMGHLSISDIKKSDGTDINWNIANLQPNQSFGGSYKVEVTSNINYYVRLLFKASVTPLSGKTHATGCGDNVTDPTDILDITIDGAYTKSATKTNSGYTAYYKLSPTKVTAAKTTETFNIDLKAQNWVGSGSCEYYMGATVSINLQAEVMQADYLESQDEGGTVASVATMHSLWSSIMAEPVLYTVSISNTLTGATMSNESGSVTVSTNVYYATDGETSWHTIAAGEDVTLQVAEAILFTMDNTKAVDWYSTSTTAPIVPEEGDFYVRVKKDGVSSNSDVLYDSCKDRYAYPDAYYVRGYIIEQDTSFEIWCQG